MAFNMVTTSSISGLLLGFSSKHCVIIFARELGQQLGISEYKIWNSHVTTIYLPQANSKTVHVTFFVIWLIFEDLQNIDMILLD
ncbi:hypothetical protein FCV25MIE_21450 [Fagus crenata]